MTGSRSCISLPEPAVDCSPTSSWDTRQLPLLSGMPTAAKSFESEPQRDGSPACTCTRETFGCSIHPNTRDEWIASQRASLARTLASPAVAQVSRAIHAADYGLKSFGLLASFDPVSCSLKTSQQSLVSDSTPCSPILPSWGLMRDGAVYALPTLERLISVTDGGAWPTPNVVGYRSDGELRLLGAMVSDETEFNQMTHRAAASKRAAWWPTPTSTLGSKGGRVTPRKSSEGGTLIEAVSARMFPTPTASDYKSGSMTEAKRQEREAHPRGEKLANEIGGSLSPTWVEWLMGWPLAWTASKHWATVKSPRKQRSRGESSQEAK